MFNIQQQEEWDYENGCASELQNAYSISTMETEFRTPEIDAALNAGKFVLIDNIPVQCPRTDAYLRWPKQRLVSVHDTREEAEAAKDIQVLNVYEEHEGHFSIEPEEVKPLTLYDPTDDSCPF